MSFNNFNREIGTMKDSLTSLSTSISSTSIDAKRQGWKSVDCWGGRIEAFDSQLWPLFCSNNPVLEKRKTILKRLNKTNKFNVDARFRVYLLWFRLLNVVLAQNGMYPAKQEIEELLNYD